MRYFACFMRCGFAYFFVPLLSTLGQRERKQRERKENNNNYYLFERNRANFNNLINQSYYLSGCLLFKYNYYTALINFSLNLHRLVCACACVCVCIYDYKTVGMV